MRMLAQLCKIQKSWTTIGTLEHIDLNFFIFEHIIKHKSCTSLISVKLRSTVAIDTLGSPVSLC